MTRSGGLWPSIHERMLMMTFSPMSIRPSMVRRAHVRQEHHVGQLQELGVYRRLVLIDIEAGAGQLAPLQHSPRAASSMISPRAVFTRMACG